MKIDKKDSATNRSLHKKLIVPAIVLTLTAAACGGVDTTTSEYIEGKEENSILLDRFVFSYSDFQPEVGPHQEALRECFNAVKTETLLEGTYLEEVYSEGTYSEETETLLEGTYLEETYSNFDDITSSRAEGSNHKDFKVVQNVLRSLTLCNDFEGMNLGSYQLFVKQIRNPNCHESIFWERYHIVRILDLSVSFEEAETFGAEIAECTDYGNKSISSYSELYPWFDWNCLESLNIEELYDEEGALEFAEFLLEEADYVPVKKSIVKSENIIGHFVECIDLKLIAEFLNNNEPINIRSSIIDCVNRAIETQDLVELLNRNESMRLRTILFFLTGIIPSCAINN